jgi:hypothetical protein
MGWRIEYLDEEHQEPIYFAPGALGTEAWIDPALDYGVVFLVEADDVLYAQESSAFVHGQLMRMAREAIKAAY